MAGGPAEAPSGLRHGAPCAILRAQERSAGDPGRAQGRELREVLGDKDAKADEIKAKLTALRAAKEQSRQELVKARENLRQIMTLRQEAVLVLNGLLE